MIMPICIIYACYLKQSSLNLVQLFIINMSILVPSTITATIASIINSDAFKRYYACLMIHMSFKAITQ